MTPTLLTSPPPHIEPVEDATRREFIHGVGAAALAAAFLAACGSEDDANADDANGGNAPETRTIETSLGPVDVPIAPQRVVTLNPVAFETAINVGIVPVASVSNVTTPSQDRLDDVEVLLTPGEIDLEAVVAIQPDLILTTADDEGEPIPPSARELEAVAPLVAEELISSAEWKEMFRSFADALNQGDEAEAVLSAYDERVAELRSAVGDPSQVKVRVIRVRESDGMRVHLRDSFPGTVLDDVGFARPDAEPEEGFSKPCHLNASARSMPTTSSCGPSARHQKRRRPSRRSSRNRS